MKNKYSESLYNLFWIFLAGCVAGWIIEGIFTYISDGVLINHSALVIGPFNVAYGLGTITLTELLYRYKNASNYKIFAIGFLGGTILEYIMSLGMELFLGFTAWDYSTYPLNINGRVCVLFSGFWGVLAIFWLRAIYPWLLNLIKKINKELGQKLCIGIIVFMLLDMCLTISAIVRAKQKDKGVLPQNKYEEFLDLTFNREYLDNMFCGNFR